MSCSAAVKVDQHAKGAEISSGPAALVVGAAACYRWVWRALNWCMDASVWMSCSATTNVDQDMSGSSRQAFKEAALLQLVGGGFEEG